jgi:hypothetical protein
MIVFFSGVSKKSGLLAACCISLRLLRCDCGLDLCADGCFCCRLPTLRSAAVQAPMGKSPAKWIKSVLFGKKSSSKSGSARTKDVSVS